MKGIGDGNGNGNFRVENQRGGKGVMRGER